MTLLEARPDPDQLLRRVVAEAAREKRGKLTVFFGAAPGVGKTYAMLEIARSEMEREKRDVVVGIVETHGRYETGAQLLGLELLARRKVAYKGVELEELDLDAALARRPQVLLVDELAHSNAEGSRHPKRWQDVEELLDAGIDVFSTMNVQHVESLNDVIARITGVHVRETVPDALLAQAHELKLVDLPPDDLLERLREGKVYLGAQAERALENFFKKGNLIALRELALRHTAERVDAQMREYREAQGIEQAWTITDQLLVAVSPSPYSARLVRAARRMAGSLHARWYAVYVEPRSPRRLSREAAARLSQNLGLAEQLGAEVVTLSGDNPTEELLRFAREHHVTKLIVGKPLALRLRDRFRASLVDQLVRSSGDIDVYVTAGDPEPDSVAADAATKPAINVPGYLIALGIPAAATGLTLPLFGRDQLPDVVMIYLLGIMLVASRLGLAESLFAAFASVAAFDFFFVPPFLTLRVADFRHTTTFAVMFVVAAVISGLTQRVRNQAAAAREREQRTAALYALTRELAAVQGSANVIGAGARQISWAFAAQVSVFTPEPSGTLARRFATSDAKPASERELSVAQWVWGNRREAGLGTTTLPSGDTLYLPLLAAEGLAGVLGVTPSDPERWAELGQRRQLDAFAAQLALALERAALAEEGERIRREITTEQLRSSLLSSVSHDLRTPLAVITGSTSTLLQANPGVDEATRQDLLRTVLEEAERLNRLIRNLLDMTRLESGALTIKKEWLPLEEAVGGALVRLESRLGTRDVRVDLPAELPLVPCDPVLLEQALIHLLENAAKYSDKELEISASADARSLTVTVADRGPGIPAGQEERVFEKFQQVGKGAGREGVGLGLTICRAIIAAHGGKIWVTRREGGGAAFLFTLPLDGPPQSSPLAEAPQPMTKETPA